MKKVVRNVCVFVIIAVFVGINLMLVKNLTEDKSEINKMKPKIVIISHVLTNPYWNYVKLGAEKAAKERNAVIDFQGPDTANVEEGIRLINMAAAAKVNGIITYVQDENKYNSVINKVVKSGIPLVTVDSDAEKSNRLAYVGTDNVEAGKFGGQEVIKQVGVTGKIGIIMGGKNVKNQIERVKGFKEYLSKNSKLTISDIESSDSYLLEAEIAAKRILVNNWDVKALFCTSALDGLGAERAVALLNLDKKVKVICFDDLPETLDKIKAGKICATIVQKPYYMGYKAVNIIMDNLEGKKTKGLFLTDVYVIQKSNVDEYIKKQGDYK
jgi:ribose transport system substrate-binding protein